MVRKNLQMTNKTKAEKYLILYLSAFNHYLIKYLLIKIYSVQMRTDNE